MYLLRCALLDLHSSSLQISTHHSHSTDALLEPCLSTSVSVSFHSITDCLYTFAPPPHSAVDRRTVCVIQILYFLIVINFK
jgi:hypothetical protein